MTAPARPSAAVFFARDFLSAEFPKMRAAFDGLARVYLVMNAREAASVREHDADGVVILVGDAGGNPQGSGFDDAPAIGRDRTLRFAPDAEITASRRAIAGACEAVLSRFNPVFYLDEPVSGYANEVFSRRFAGAGALSLHFQVAWLPGTCFFVSDAAQAAPVPLNLLSGSADLVRRHVQLRAEGLARPAYVLSYANPLRRLKDIAITLGKAAYRRLRRRKANWVDRDTSAHLFHAQSLWRSLTGRYSRDPADNPGDARFVVFPLHYEPESLLSYFSRFYRQEEIASQILDTLPDGYRLVLKEHPSQPGALMLPKWAGLRAADRVVVLPGTYPASRLMPLKPVVISLGSTFALEAAVAGCPVGVLGGVHFRGAPGIVALDSPSDWREVLGAEPGSAEAVSQWYADFLDRYGFKGNFLRGQTWFEDLPALGTALAAARAAKEG